MVSDFMSLVTCLPAGKSRNGFTIIEIIAVLIIVGIVSAVVVSRFSSTDIYAVKAETEALKTNLRFAQVRAMSDIDPWGISFSSNSYTLQKNSATATLNLPNENSATCTLKHGVTVSSPPANAVTFDEWGSPGTSTITITLTKGSTSETVTVTRNTGFIP